MRLILLALVISSKAFSQFNQVPDAKPVTEFYNTTGIYQSVDRVTKPLTKVMFYGNSLLGNAPGASIPVGLDEGAGKRPPRSIRYDMVRQFYDTMSWNKPIFRRVDDAAWTKSGTWTQISDGTNFMFPVNDGYFQNTTANNYIEIVVPDGMENFAVLFQKDQGHGSVTVTLNGGSIASYGNSSVNLARTRGANSMHTQYNGTTFPYNSNEHAGNCFHIEEYTGLPAGSNTIRITRNNGTEKVVIWGGFWWTGNTMICLNAGQSGHTMKQLIEQHLYADLVENNPDLVFFEVTEMNDVAPVNQRGLSNSLYDFRHILQYYLHDRDVLITTCHAMGFNGSYNLYTVAQDELNREIIKIARDSSYPIVDIFEAFRWRTKINGGTYEAGDSGTLWTTDGQHQNTAGVTGWVEYLINIFANTGFKE